MRIAVVTPTRNRPEHIGRLVGSVLESTHPDLELTIVDQSTDDRTQQAVAAAGGDRRVRYLHQAAKGRSRALNYGIRASTGEAIAMTDDDCEPRRDWLEAIARLLHDTAADVICGKVSAMPHDPSQGYVLGYDPGSSRLISGRRYSHRGFGLGANLAARREAFDRIGYFDEMLGVGTSMPSGEDRDFLYRAARKGCSVLLSPEPEVIHYGYRSYGEDGRDHGRSLAIGHSIAYVKYIRQGDAAALYHCLSDWLDQAGIIAGRVARRQRPLGFNRLRYMIAGVPYGIRHPLDPRTMVFVPPHLAKGSTPQKG